MNYDEHMIRLLRNIGAKLSSHLNECYRSYGITGVQGLVLMEVSQNPDCKVSDLANQLMMSNSNLSAILKRMEQNDLLKRIRGKKDERVVYLELSDHGKDILVRMREEIQEYFPLIKNASEEKKQQVIDCLEMLDDMLEEMQNEG